jgi:hypothetical protein
VLAIPYMNDDVIVDHSSSVYSLDSSSRSGVFQNTARHVKFLVKGADDEVTVQNVRSVNVDQSLEQFNIRYSLIG